MNIPHSSTYNHIEKGYNEGRGEGKGKNECGRGKDDEQVGAGGEA